MLSQNKKEKILSLCMFHTNSGSLLGDAFSSELPNLQEFVI
jgi:hypothetical protein